MQLSEEQYQVLTKVKNNGAKATKNQTVLYGDSIIEFLNMHNFNDELIYNCGIRQSSSKDLLNMLDEVMTIYQPKTVVLLAGANDLSDANQHSLTFIVENINKMIYRLLQEYQVEKIGVILPLPIDEKQKATSCRNNEVMRDLGIKLKQLIANYKQVEAIDCFSKLTNKNNQLASEYTVDGIHLNDQGSKILIDQIKMFLK